MTTLIYSIGFIFGVGTYRAYTQWRLHSMLDDTLELRGEHGGLAKYIQAKKTLEAFGGKPRRKKYMENLRF